MLASGLGVLRGDSLAARSLTTGPDAMAHALSTNLLVLTEASAPSAVARSVYPYYVGVKTFAADGTVTGEHGVGLLKRRGLAAEMAPEVMAMHHAVKRALDPHGVLNPGKVLT